MKKRRIISASLLIALTAALGGCSNESRPTKPNTIIVNSPSDSSTSLDNSPDSTSSGSESTSSSYEPESSQSSPTSSEIPPADITPPDGEVIFANNIAIVGTRAMSLYGANPKNFKTYAEALNKYKEALPDISVYSMVVPVACEYYAPPEVAEKCASQKAHISIVNENLMDIRAVDVYSALAKHAGEDIYLKTDHHWAPLGGYYAAEEFAKTAGVPFLPLSDYEKRVNTGFCGSMYGYSGDHEILKNNPEEFVYYVPQTVKYTTTYYNYKISGWDVIGAYDPSKGSFFLNYGDNRSDNYCTFMGGDAKIVHVKTETENGRRLLIIKDSYGNAAVPFLFGSFEDIYVTDLRFFSHNMTDYIREHGITDLLFINNTTIAGNPSMSQKLDTIRTQEDMGF
ncbi:MAG: hypothetical protein K2N56_09900 [Oscillospiraceae bacterium]|nr:hypothetical protein [Oscillospiraceae bacterium]